MSFGLTNKFYVVIQTRQNEVTVKLFVKKYYNEICYSGDSQSQSIKNSIKESFSWRSERKNREIASRNLRLEKTQCYTFCGKKDSCLIDLKTS